MPCKVTLFYRDRQEVTINKKADKNFHPPNPLLHTRATGSGQKRSPNPDQKDFDI